MKTIILIIGAMLFATVCGASEERYRGCPDEDCKGDYCIIDYQACRQRAFTAGVIAASKCWVESFKNEGKESRIANNVNFFLCIDREYREAGLERK